MGYIIQSFDPIQSFITMAEVLTCTDTSVIAVKYSMTVLAELKKCYCLNGEIYTFLRIKELFTQSMKQQK